MEVNVKRSIGVLSLALIVWLFTSCSNAPVPTWSADEAIAMIRDGKVKAAAFRASETTFTSLDDRRWIVTVRTDTDRERLFYEVVKFNAGHAKQAIEVVEEPAQSGYGWFMAIKAMPFLFLLLFFAFWAATLVVIVWAVKRFTARKE